MGESTEIMELTPTGDNSTYKLQLRKRPDVIALTDQIYIKSPNTILCFGQGCTSDIARVSEKLIQSMKGIKSDQINASITQLTKIMQQFDIKELTNTKVSFFTKLFGKDTVHQEDIIERYDLMSQEVDKIYVVLQQYAKEIQTSNKQLNDMYEVNLKSLNQIANYIVAGELAIEEIERKHLPVVQRLASTGNPLSIGQLHELQQAQKLLEQRVYDLKLAENIAMQTLTMIKAIEYNNLNLVGKLNSAFLLTLPIFKQCIVQAMMLKKQQIQADGMKNLEKTANQALIQHSKNVVSQTVAIASDTSDIVPTLETVWQTINEGIIQTQQIELENQKLRLEHESKLQVMKKPH